MTLLVQPAARVFRRNWLVYRKIWYRSLFFGFLQPLMFLTAMGLGLGGLVNTANSAAFNGISFIDFIGPGLMAANAMQTATFESSYPIMNKIMWGRNYEAMLSTPLGTRHILLGELFWIGFRLLTVATMHLPRPRPVRHRPHPARRARHPGRGADRHRLLVLPHRLHRHPEERRRLQRRVPLRREPALPVLGHVLPASGPGPAFAWATPLFHGVELARGLVLNRLDLAAAPLHLAYLLAFAAIGLWLADRNLRPPDGRS